MYAKQVYFIAHFLLIGLALTIVSALSFHLGAVPQYGELDNNLLIALATIGVLNLVAAINIWWRGDKEKGFTHFAPIAFITSSICFVFFLIRAVEHTVHTFRDNDCILGGVWNLTYLVAGLLSFLATIILHEFGSFA